LRTLPSLRRRTPHPFCNGSRSPDARSIFQFSNAATADSATPHPDPRTWQNTIAGITGAVTARPRATALAVASESSEKSGAARAGHLLDVGCGDGTFLLAARAAGWSVAGTEMNTAPARQAGLDVYAAISDVRSLAPFDSITLWHTFEHLTDPRATLGEIRGLLSPKGVLIIAVPNAGGLQARAFGAKWFHLDVPRHLYHFTRPSLANLLRSEGFIPFREWHQEFEYDLLGWSQSALNSGARASQSLL